MVPDGYQTLLKRKIGIGLTEEDERRRAALVLRLGPEPEGVVDGPPTGWGHEELSSNIDELVRAEAPNVGVSPS